MSRQATVLVLLVAIVSLLLFGKGKLPRAWLALWGPPGTDTQGEPASAQKLATGVMGFGVATLITLAVADTPLYPAVLGLLIIVMLYLLTQGGGLAAVAYLDKTLTKGGKKA